ncbi:hypothetical protein G9F71_000660 [Clostridium sp. FP2]|uniref:hypothetical protein n=1 Tax=Clostridium sp. FP2 TaxID=2724481 RepID=UPI001CCBE3EA|nr:hypothetical protein [Clostridium sp. FP2]MBZ9621402.1 hypothetical protein [Clostridium sp. FP2]
MVLKLDGSIDLMCRRMKTKFKKLEEKGDKFNSLFGFEDFKKSSPKERFSKVFKGKENY